MQPDLQGLYITQDDLKQIAGQPLCLTARLGYRGIQNSRIHCLRHTANTFKIQYPINKFRSLK